jgi:hypothetical protein
MVLMRRGLGKGLGRGYKNIVPYDPHVHSLSAKGIKSKSKPFLTKQNTYDFGTFPTDKKRGLIRELARKVVDGVGYAIEWEKEHLPKQKAWVKKEFEKAKKQFKKGKTAREIDAEDVRDELDTDDDGDQDIPVSELDKVNYSIQQDLQTIDVDESGVADYIEDGFMEIKDEKQELDFPLPVLNPKETFGGKVKKKLRTGYETAQHYVQERQKTAQELSLEMQKMSDAQLEEKAVRMPKGFFGGNAYEKELLRRQKVREKIKHERLTTRQKAKQDVKAGKGAGIDVSFLNPLSAFKKK